MTPLSAPSPGSAHVGIVGAGLAGLGAALALRDTPAQVTLIEKSRGPSGRAATRRKDGFTYDFGANFIDLAASEEVRRLVEAHVPEDERVRVDGEIWTHDATGQIAPGHPSEQERYTLREGINRLGHRLLHASGAAIHTQVRALQARKRDGAWWVACEGGSSLGPFDALVLTPPAPQSADLLSDADPLAQALRRVPYHAQFSVVLALTHPVPAHEGVYAFLNTDRAHPIAWLAFESRKAGHVPQGQEALVVQMAPAWTRDHFEDDPAAIVEAATAYASRLLGAPLDVAWADVQRWRYALPTLALNAEAARTAEERGLYVASDAVLGKGRAAGALQVGLDTGRHLRAALRR